MAQKGTAGATATTHLVSLTDLGFDAGLGYKVGSVTNLVRALDRWSVRWQGGTMYKNGSTVTPLIGGGFFFFFFGKDHS